MTAALVLFSAGQDSATCLAWALARYERVETIGFAYGQRHAVELAQRPIVLEAVAALSPPGRLGEDIVVDLAGYGALAESALTADRAIEMQENGLPSTFVPGRNLVFLAVAAAHAYRRGIATLIGGMCETDYSGYPDCRDDTLKALQVALSLGMGQRFILETPLMWLDKAQTWALAHQLGGDALVDLSVRLTHTCYLGERGQLHAWGHGCGECPACTLRRQGYERWMGGSEATF